MKNSAKRVGSILYLLFTLALVVVLGTATGDVWGAWHALLRVQPQWLLAALGCWSGFILFRAAALMFYCGQQNRPLTFFGAMRVTIIGQYYSGVTPAATGGQPMQVYELTRCSISPSIGTVAVLVETFGFQIAHMLLATILWILYRAPIRRLLVGVHWVMVLGYAANMLWSALLALIFLKSGSVGGVLDKCVRLLARLRIVRDPERITSRVRTHAEDFHQVVRLLLKRPALMVAALLFSTAQALSYFSILYFIYRGFGWDARPYGLILAIQTLMHLSASIAPTPGASGAQEGAFYLFFRWIFPERSLFPALLVWRFFTYYFMLLVGAVTIAFGVLTGSGRRRRSPR